MKKILLLILTLFLFFACYIIYESTESKSIKYVLLGDELANNPYIIKNECYNNDFIDKDLRIVDLVRIIKYNEEIVVNSKSLSIHQQLNEADVLVISIGISEIVSKLEESTKDKYTYVNKFIYYLNELFNLIDDYDYKQVFFIGYNNNQELFNYLNWNIEKMVNERGFYFIKIDEVEKKQGLFTLNDDSYKKIYNFIVEKLENY